jgi:Spy/CpxP family protein refolding chaperone
MKIISKGLIILGVTSMLFAVVPSEEVGVTGDVKADASCYKSCDRTSKIFFKGIELSEEQQAKAKEICKKYKEELNSVLTAEQATQVEAQKAEVKPAVEAAVIKVEATEIKVAEPEVKEEAVTEQAVTEIEVNVTEPVQQVI